MPNKVIAIGVRPIAPLLFWDYDNKYFEKGENGRETLVTQAKKYHDMKHPINEGGFDKHWQIYSTGNGFHLVQLAKSWKEVKERLLGLREICHNAKYIMNPKDLVLRISPKWEVISGEPLNPSPKLVQACKCYGYSLTDLRVGEKEIYHTWEANGRVNTVTRFPKHEAVGNVLFE